MVLDSEGWFDDGPEGLAPTAGIDGDTMELDSEGWLDGVGEVDIPAGFGWAACTG